MEKMNYHIITSLNKKYWTESSYVNLLTWDYFFPSNVIIHVFSEDGKLAEISDRVIWHDLYNEIPSLLEFIDFHKDDPHYNSEHYKWNAIKFAHKTFPIFKLKNELEEPLIWLDADVICLKELDEYFFETAFPNNKSISYLGRKNKHSECGFMYFNLKTEVAREFLNIFENYYKDKNLRQISQTHDSFVFDAVKKEFENNKTLVDLNSGSNSDKNPFGNSLIGEYLVHNKGKGKTRKQRKFLKRHGLEF